MAIERIFNIFVYFNGGVATEYGIHHYQADGSDQEKTDYLLSRIDQDHAHSKRFRFPRSFTPQEWLSVFRLGNELEFFEEAFTLFDAPQEFVFCITSVVDGQPTIEKQIGPEPYRGDVVTEQEGWGSVPDYLMLYRSGNTFHFTELINDDYFNAIRALYNAKLYVSCSKLLMSCVDTLAFVEYGDVPHNFTNWVDTYLDLTPHGISANELWEFRNSVLHMTNLASRKVVAGKVSPIMPYVGVSNSMSAISPNGAKRFNLFELIKTVCQGIGKWGEVFNAEPDKMLKFIERYDTTISDSRMVWVPHCKAK